VLLLLQITVTCQLKNEFSLETRFSQRLKKRKVMGEGRCLNFRQDLFHVDPNHPQHLDN
jgi:hypothetical protein